MGMGGNGSGNGPSPPRDAFLKGLGPRERGGNGGNGGNGDVHAPSSTTTSPGGVWSSCLLSSGSSPLRRPLVVLGELTLREWWEVGMVGMVGTVTSLEVVAVVFPCVSVCGSGLGARGFWWFLVGFW